MKLMSIVAVLLASVVSFADYNFDKKFVIVKADTVAELNVALQEAKADVIAASDAGVLGCTATQVKTTYITNQQIDQETGALFYSGWVSYICD